MRCFSCDKQDAEHEDKEFRVYCSSCWPIIWEAYDEMKYDEEEDIDYDTEDTSALS